MKSLEETIENAFDTTSFGKNKTDALNILKNKYKHHDIEEIRDILMPYIAKIYEVPLSRSQANKNFGALTLDKTHPRYEGARKMLYRLAMKIKM
jgi:hypothetical protein